MKRNSHPLRRKPRHHISAAERHEYHMSGYDHLLKRTPKRRSSPFLRVRTMHASDLEQAGYPFASLNSGDQWEAAQAWLQANCVRKSGMEYAWFGGTFIFVRQSDHDAFVKEFNLAPGYRPLFAFETGTKENAEG